MRFLQAKASEISTPRGMLMRFLQAKVSEISTPRNLALTTPIPLLPQPIFKFVYNALELQISVSFVKV